MMLPDPLHPALVHFPIALILLGAAFAVIALAFPRRVLVVTTAVILGLGAVGALAAAWSGEEDEEAAEHAGPGAERVFEEHEEWGERARNAAIVAALAAGFAVFAHKRLPRLARAATTLTAALAIAASWCVIQAGHYGGLLVYQHGVGVKHSAAQTDKAADGR